VATGSAKVLEALSAIVGGEQLLTAAAELRHYGLDRTRHWPPAPLAVVRPGSAAEVCDVLRLANRERLAVVPSGGRTGLSGGAVAARGELVLSLERLRRILAVDRESATLTCEAGVTTAEVQAAARAAGLWYPVDFASAGSSQIGGNIATNAGGIRVLRHGMTRAWVRGLQVVTGAGELLELGHGLAKDNTGYDLCQLFIGSEGTLGVVCAATLALAPPPPPSAVLLLGAGELAALPAVLAAFRERCALCACEFFSEAALARVVAQCGLARPFAPAPWYLLLELEQRGPDSLESALELFAALRDDGLVRDGVLAQHEAQAQALWRLREEISDTLAAWQPYKNDVAVRTSRLPEFLERARRLCAERFPDLEMIWFGHLGDGNIHINALRPDAWSGARFQALGERLSAELGALVAEFGGSISAEHGIGLLKKPLLHYSRSAAEIDLMRAVKAVFDPNGILNPGKIFD
jgi:FAD/FMN-containing dehydrogenase